MAARFACQLLIALMFLLVSAGSPFIALAEEVEPLKSGLQVGESVPQFYVRAVTGPLKNKSVCYVCRNGDRPVIMLLARKVTPELTKLLKDVDQLVDRHRANGLRGFGVFVAAVDAKDLLPRLQTVSFDEDLSLPLTIAVSSTEGPTGQKLHADAALTVVLYREQSVVANFAFRDGELTRDGIARIVETAGRLAKGEIAPSPTATARRLAK